MLKKLLIGAGITLSSLLPNITQASINNPETPTFGFYGQLDTRIVESQNTNFGIYFSPYSLYGFDLGTTLSFRSEERLPEGKLLGGGIGIERNIGIFNISLGARGEIFNSGFGEYSGGDIESGKEPHVTGESDLRTLQIYATRRFEFKENRAKLDITAAFVQKEGESRAESIEEIENLPPNTSFREPAVELGIRVSW